MTRLVLIRHGEAQSAVEGILGGDRGCTGLSDLGRRQADALAARLERTHELADAAALYASTLPRAIETAERIAPVLGLDVQAERDLREWDPGEADGLTFEELERRWPSAEYDPYVPRNPGAEAWCDFRSRATAKLEELAGKHRDETVVIACHGGIIEHAFHLWGVDRIEGVPLETRNTSITELRWADPWPWHTAPGKSWRLVRHNDAAHLYDIADGVVNPG